MTDLDGQEREALKRLLAVTELPGTRTEIAPEMERAKSFARAALAAREKPQRKSAILGIGTVTNGVAEGWLFDGGDAGLTLLADGTQLAGGWSVEELELISHIVAYAREDTERPDVRAIIAAVGYLFADQLPEELRELLGDADDDLTRRVAELVELRDTEAHA